MTDVDVQRTAASHKVSGDDAATLAAGRHVTYERDAHPCGASRRCCSPPQDTELRLSPPAAAATADTAVEADKGRLGGSCPSAKTPALGPPTAEPLP
jgi:hypothetical protein